MVVQTGRIKQSRRRFYSRGFTLVELLVVIVVIAILAAIIIVAYNGLQVRARESSIKGQASQINRKAKLFAVGNSDSAACGSCSTKQDIVAAYQLSSMQDRVFFDDLTAGGGSTNANAAKQEGDVYIYKDGSTISFLWWDSSRGGWWRMQYPYNQFSPSPSTAPDVPLTYVGPGFDITSGLQ